MRDKARNYPLGSGLKMPALHGHTTIELHNHKTGFRERIEHDNTFTDGITNYLLSSGWFDNSPFRNDTWRAQPLYQSLVGGILLFDSEIEDDNGVFPTMMPAGVKMIANGSYGVANNSAVTEMGTYNAQESSFTDSAYTFVYDWTTSQGNGEIASVSLTSDLGGYIGYGNSVSQVAHSTKKNWFENQNSNSLNFGADMAYYIKDNSIYYAPINQTSGTTLTFKERQYGLNDELSLFRGEITHTSDLPNSIKNQSGIYEVAQYDKGFAIIVFPDSNKWDVGETIKIGFYDVVNGTWETTTCTRTSGGEWDIIPANNRCNVISGDYMMSTGYYTTGGDLVKLSTGVSVANNLNSHAFFELSDGLYCYDGSRIRDHVNGTTYPTNANIISATDNSPILTIDGNRIMSRNSGSSGYVRVYRNPLYLATVNNLEEVVTKTSAMSMKVTYTVTPATE